MYDDVREKLVARGVPKEEVAFIHEYNTEAKKADLFAKVRAGQVRILMGSTPKLGAGTNVQDRLIALHHLDCPWKPSDVGRFADIQNKKECGGNRQWQNHYLRNWAANTKGKGII